MPSTAGNDLDSVFSWPAGRVRTAFAASVPGVLADLKEWAADPDRAPRIVTVGFDRLPGPRALMGRATALLAEVALALWPDWYGGAVASPAGDRTAFEFEGLLGARLAPTGRVRREVSVAWVKTAAALCRSGRPPTPRGFSPAIQVAQLALAIDPGDLLITLYAEDAQPPAGGLLGLARTAEWLAKGTSARVLVVVPAALASSALILMGMCCVAYHEHLRG
jgi:hypothetical protein